MALSCEFLGNKDFFSKIAPKPISFLNDLAKIEFPAHSLANHWQSVGLHLDPSGPPQGWDHFLELSEIH